MIPFETLEWLSLARWYEQAPWTIDGLIYLVLFTGVAKVSLGRRFEGRGGAAVIGALGLALAIGATTFSIRSGFTLAQLGPIAWAILLTLLGLLLFDLCRSTGLGITASASLAILVLGLAGSGLGLQDILVAMGLASLFAFAMLLAVFFLIWKVLSHVGGVREGGGTRGGFGSGGRHTYPSGFGSSGNTEDAPIDPEAIDTLTRVEVSISELLDRLERRVHSQGIGPHTERLLDEIARRERIVRQLYRRSLRELARRHWRSGGTIEDALRSLLLAAQENVSAFERALDVARAALASSNTQLLLQAIAKLRSIEQEGIRLTLQLREQLRRLREGMPGRGDSRGGHRGGSCGGS